ncbi:MAG: ribosome biogenesis factor YjgA [Methylococcales bacterium]|nr:ribosome biogenesis factor YjgA [Methylococcales bacterium]MDP3839508.1 ribosome biogenesis factor YjgA [Methylococcales bacterium]
MNEELDYEYEYDEHGEIVYYAVRPNKTKIKKEIATLFTLGEEMAALSLTHIKSLELPENINKAVLEVSRMPHTGARKRLLKYIAGQLHKIETEPFIAKVARINNTSAHAVREHHLAEHWRDKLIAKGNDALTEFLYEYDHADRQQLRQLMRNAQKEAELAKPPKSSRLLYRYLKELLQAETEETLALSADDDQEDDEQEFDDEFDEFDDEDEFDEFDEDEDDD